MEAKQSDECHTPLDLFAYCDKRWGPFTLDAAATFYNCLCPRWCGPLGSLDFSLLPSLASDHLGTDGLAVSWQNEVVWCNPPYSRNAVLPFVQKAPTAKRCVMLLKADFSPSWAQEAWRTANDILLIQGRVAFGGPGALVNGKRQGAAFSSMLVVWRSTPRIHNQPHVSALANSEWKYRPRGPER